MERTAKKPKPLPAGRRKILSASEENLISIEYPQPGQTLPLIVKPAVEGVNLISWAENTRPWIEAQVSKYGAILFRNHNVRTASEFEQFITAASGRAMLYRERSSPRHQVSGNIYTSTDHPPDQSIFLHNEQSYNLTFPLRIFFFCITPARQGGETPLADTRKIFKRIDPEIRERLTRKNYMYVRNYGDGFGLTWQTAFQTEQKAAVEEYCYQNGIEFEWKEFDRLRTRQVRRVCAAHPRTGEMVWFNHAIFFHISTLEPQLQKLLLTTFKEDDLPSNTYYGDGSLIEDSTLAHLREAYRAELTTFSWQEGDLLMVDNMLTSHGRAPFVGPREVVVGMAEPYSWNDV